MKERLSNKLMATMLITIFVLSAVGIAFNTPNSQAVDTYYYLTVDYAPSIMPEPETAPTVGVHAYTVGSVINVTAPLIVNDTVGVRWVFLNWTVIYPDNSTWSTTNNKFQITMNENKTAIAYYKVQYLFTVVTAFDKPYMFYSGGWHQESSHWFDPYTIVYAGVKHEYVDLNFSMKAKCVGWSGAWSGKIIDHGLWVRTDAINMTEPKTAVANWVIEYFLTKGSAYGPWSPPVPYALGKYYTSVEKAIDRIVLLQNQTLWGWDWDVTGATAPTDLSLIHISEPTRPY